MPDRAVRWRAVLAGVLLALDLLIGLLTLVVLGLSVTFGTGGFGGDTTMAAADRSRESQGQFAGITALLLAVSAVLFFMRLRRAQDLRVLVLAGLAFAESAGLALLLRAAG